MNFESVPTEGTVSVSGYPTPMETWAHCLKWTVFVSGDFLSYCLFEYFLRKMLEYFMRGPMAS